MERVADCIINKLEEAGIGHIFLITGRGILYLSDAVARNTAITGVSVFHEQSASYAAMAYAQSNGKMGACLVSTGCAATNAVTGALCAWQDNIPCIFVSGQHMLNETTRYTQIPIRTYGSQEADIIEIVKPITKYAVMLTDPQKTVYELEKALYLAQSGRKGPVWIDVPLDVQNMRIESDQLEHFIPQERQSADTEDMGSVLKEIAAEIREAKRPIVLAGGGVRCAGAEKILRTLIEKYRIPMVFSHSAADIYGCGHELSIGAVGSLGGSRAGNFAIQNADYILALGTKLCSQCTGTDFSKFAREAKITVVDIDEAEHTKKEVSINRVVISDAKVFLEKLCLENLQLSCSEWVQKCVSWKNVFGLEQEEFIKDAIAEDKIDLYYFADQLSQMLADDAAVITDAGFEELIIPAAIPFKEQQRCLFPAAQGAMGYAIPAIIGAYFAGKTKLVAVVGDGSVMMNIQELQTISFHRIPVKIIVINNNMYAIIRRRQKDLFRSRTIGNDPSDGVACPDFKKIAEGFQLDYMKIEKASELADKLQILFQHEGPVLCEIMCTENQKYFHSSYALNKDRKLVRRPIEDLSPFLDREKFLAEMIVEPIDQ